MNPLNGNHLILFNFPHIPNISFYVSSIFLQRMSPYNKPGALGTRVRRNVKDLSPQEWGRFVNALKVMKARTRPGAVVSIYDEFTALHMGAVEMNRNWRRSHEHLGSVYVSEDGPADPAHDNPGRVSI